MRLLLAAAALMLACAEGAGEGTGSGTPASTAGSGGTMDAASTATSASGGGSTSASVGGSGGMGGASSASSGGSPSCTLSTQCAVTEYCDFPDDQCGAGAPGSCVPRPPNCMNVYDPKCGCDQLSYSNTCFAAVAGQDVDAFGLCN